MSVPHRWSGWPGAWCLDCGVEDQGEICVADHDDGVKCIHGHVMCEDKSHPGAQCTVHVNTSCLEPGSRRHDPYARADEVKKDAGS